MESDRALAVTSKDQLPRLTTDNLVERVRLIAEVMERVMKKDEHYGRIPGTPKPTLLKPGAEKLCNTFMLDPQYEEVSCHEGEDFVSFRIRCTLYHQTTGNRIASGLGACNSREKKYRYTWIDSKEKPAKEEADKLKADGIGRWRNTGTKERPSWTWQNRKDNANPMDLQNTMYKMACKRALVAATLNATGASDIFTQDLEDLQADQEPAKEAEAEVVGGREVPSTVQSLHEEVSDAREDGGTGKPKPLGELPPSEQERVEEAFGGEGEIEEGDSTAPQRSAIHKMLGALGFKDDMAKCEKVSSILGKDPVILSLSVLSKRDASTVIKALGEEMDKRKK